jgi:hypothetical protein
MSLKVVYANVVMTPVADSMLAVEAFEPSVA